MGFEGKEVFLLKADREIVFDREAQRLNTVGKLGPDIVGASADLKRDRLQDPQNGSLITTFNTATFDVGAASVPGVSVDRKTFTLWVNSPTTDKIYNIQKNGFLISSFGVSTFDPTATNIQAIASDPDGTLWVTGNASKKVYNITKTGTLINSFPTTDFAAGVTDPTGLTIGPDSTIWLTDNATDKIYNISRDGQTLISSFLISVVDVGASSPQDITFDAAGNLWIVDISTDKTYNATTAGAQISNFSNSIFITAGGEVRGLEIDPSDQKFWASSSSNNSVNNLENTGVLTDELLFVDGNFGSDTNPGTQLLPFLTFDKYRTTRTTEIGQYQIGPSLDLEDMDAPLQARRGGAPILQNTANNFAWTTRTSNITDITNLAWGRDIFLAAGPTADLASSPDGITWTLRTLPASFLNPGNPSLAAIPSDICYGNNTFLYCATVNSNSVIATSSDGITWTEQDLSPLSPAFVTGPVHCAFFYTDQNVPTFLITNGTDIAKSTDNGITWALNTTSVHTKNITGVAFGKGGKVVTMGRITTTNEIAFSTDFGTTFKLATSPFGLKFTDIAFGDGDFVITGLGGRLAVSSTGGETWGQPSHPLGTTDLNAVAYGSGYWYIAGATSGGAVKAAFSKDAGTWTQNDRGGSTNDAFSLIYGNGLYLLGRENGDLDSNRNNRLAITADLLGFQIENYAISSTELVQNCSMPNFTGPAFWDLLGQILNKIDRCDTDRTLIESNDSPGSFELLTSNVIRTGIGSQRPVVVASTQGATLKIKNSRLNSIEDTAILRIKSGSLLELSDNLIITTHPTLKALRANGLATVAGVLDVLQNKIIGPSILGNFGSGGLERYRDNIIEGAMSAAVSFTMESGNMRGLRTGFLFGPDVSRIDPQFIDLVDFELRRAAEGFASDSPLIAQSKFGTYLHQSNPFPRDLGPYNINNQLTVTTFKTSIDFLRAENLQNNVRNKARANISINAKVDVTNKPDERIEVVVMTFRNMSNEFLAFVELMDSKKDTTVELHLDAEFTDLTSVIIDGAHPANVFELNIEPQDVPLGSKLTIGGLKFNIMARFPLVGDATKLALNQVVPTALTDDQVIPLNGVSGEGVFQYLPEEEKQLKRMEAQDPDNFDGLKLTFLRKKE